VRLALAKALKRSENMTNNAREKKIVSNINLEKLPFKVLEEDIFSFTKELSLNLQKIFSLSGQKESVNWCFASQKRIKVFLIIFNANENVKSIYKEEIAKKLPEYSYKTVASIIDEGLKKGYFVNLKSSDLDKINDKKIHNIRPSEELLADFINWNIDAICILRNYYDLKKKH
tara:strand:+ start:240 stop:758 length:519 start_codon:yes stop_codon:yes gene_type:complete